MKRMSKQDRKKLYEELHKRGIDTSIGHPHNQYKVNYEVSRTTTNDGKGLSIKKRH